MKESSAMICTVMTLLAAASPEDAKLAAHFERHLEEQFRRHPVYASRVGDHRYSDRMDDLSPTARAADLADVRRALDELPKHIEYAKLSRQGQIDYDIFRHHLLSSIWSAEQLKPFETNPLTYTGYLADSVYQLLTQSTLPRERNVANAAGRMSHIPAVVRAAKQSLTNPPKVWAEQAIQRNRGTIRFYESGIYSLAGETPGVSRLTAPAKAAVEALKDYQLFLEAELLPRSTGDWRLGRDAFARKLELELDAGVTAEQVLRDAEAEADRVEREMAVIARQLWAKLFPRRPLPPDDAAGRRDLVRRVLAELAHDHGRVDGLVTDARATVTAIREFIRDRDILKLPDPDRCQIIEMPEFQRGFSVAYLNPAPPLDPSAASFYAVSPPPADWDDRRVTSYLQEYNRPMLQILTIHEAYPGHYVQLEYANRYPSKLRKILESGVFIEGWAVYTEQMMLDQGYGGGDLSLRLHQLKWYLRAVCNAILDHHMHCSDWSDRQAIDLLVNRAFQSEGEAVGKVLRAKQSSVQLSTYFVGRMAIYRLRQAVQRERGDRFDLGRFHEAVLAHGSPPVKYLPELLRAGRD